MKQDLIKKYKAAAFDWVFRALIAIVMLLVKDMREDMKQLMRTVPGLQAKVDMINDQRLIENLRAYERVPIKREDEITYDSLNRK